DFSRALALAGAIAGVEALRDEVLLFARELRQTAHDAVVVREHETFARNERAGTAALVPRNRALYAIQPGLIDRDAVCLFHRVRREILKCPHALVGKHRGRPRQGSAA